MIIQILSYFSILLTFTLLIYWPFINHFKQNEFIHRTKPYVTGIKFGVAGLILTIAAVQLVHGLMINSRIILLLFSGLLGGPISLLISGIIMGAGRLFFSDLTTVIFYINLNFIVLTIILFFVTRKIELNQQNIYKYFWICFVEMSIVLSIRLCLNNEKIFYLILYALFTIFSFYFIYYLILQVKKSSDTVQETNYLERMDYQTQLPNNFSTEEYLQCLLKKKISFNLLHIDINHFKLINSMYGYEVGDQIIKQFANLMREYSKKNDAFIGRLAGEEFIVILKDIAPAYAIIEADNFIKAIAKYEFEGPEKIHITASVGICTYPDNGTDTLSLVKSLIEAQRHAKANHKVSYFHANNLK